MVELTADQPPRWRLTLGTLEDALSWTEDEPTFHDNPFDAFVEAVARNGEIQAQEGLGMHRDVTLRWQCTKATKAV